MLIPVRCQVCNVPLDGGCLYRHILQKRQLAKGADRGVAPNFAGMALVDPGEAPDMVDVFEGLRLPRSCCRTQVARTVIMSDHL
jgi:DNA-directed RNA polymerase subunit N (RpoN/RPB10)